MFRPNVIGTDPQVRLWLRFSRWEITGCWVSPDGAPGLRIFRRQNYKNGGLWLEVTYSNPQAVYLRPIRSASGLRYFDLYGRVGIAYDPERDVLLLSTYGEYIRAGE